MSFKLRRSGLKQAIPAEKHLDFRLQHDHKPLPKMQILH